MSRLTNKLNKKTKEGSAGVSEWVYCGNLLLSMNTLRWVDIPAYIQAYGYRPPKAS
jgi:hypothetical protein